MSDCGACTGETNIKLCPGCRDKLTDDLREVESMVGALWASAARMDAGSWAWGSEGEGLLDFVLSQPGRKDRAAPSSAAMGRVEWRICM